MFFGLDNASAPQVSWPGGWTEIKDVADGNTTITAAVAYRVADGGEGASITVTTTNSAQSAHVSYLISNHDSSVNPPEISTGASGDSQSQNPDSLSPSGGSDDYLWIASTFCDGSGSTGPWSINSYPANYSNGQESLSGGATNGITVGTAERENTTDSEDPGAFSVGDAGGKEWIAFTLAVYPA